MSGPYSHTYTNAEGCDSVVTANVTINHSSTPTSFNAIACDSYTLPWGGTVTMSGPYSHTYTNAAGCDSVVTANVTINVSPSAMVTPANPAAACEGVSILLQANTGVGYTYQWYSFGNILSGETNSSYLVGPNAKKKYKVVITSPEGCSTTSNVVEINRLATPNANVIIVNPADNPDLCINGKVKLRGNGASGIPLGYQWNYNGTDIPGATNRDYIAITTGNYRVTVTNLNTGCSTLSAPVAVINTCKESSIASLQQAVFETYPNPSDGYFVIHLSLTNKSEGDAIVQVYNALGQSILGETVPVVNGDLLQEINLQDGDAAGMYMVRVIFDGQVYQGQIVVQH